MDLEVCLPIEAAPNRASSAEDWGGEVYLFVAVQYDPVTKPVF